MKATLDKSKWPAIAASKCVKKIRDQAIREWPQHRYNVGDVVIYMDSFDQLQMAVISAVLARFGQCPRYEILRMDGRRITRREVDLIQISSSRDARLLPGKPPKKTGGQIPFYMTLDQPQSPVCHVGDIVKTFWKDKKVCFGRVVSAHVPDRRGLCYTIDISATDTYIRARESDVVLIKKANE